MDKVNLLTPLQVERAQYTEQRTASGAQIGNRLADGDGLYLFVTPTNAKSWRMDYRFPKGGKKRVIVFGRFPAMPLKEARAAKLQAKLLLHQGRDPAAERRQIAEAAKQAEEESKNRNIFRAVAQEWYDEEQQARAKSESWKANMSRWISWANEDFGNKPLPEIEASDVLALIKRIAKEYPTSAESCRQVVSRVFNYGIRTLRAAKGFNPAEAIKGAVIVPPKKHHPKLTVKELPQFLRDLDAHDAPERLKLGIKILLHSFPRKNELAGAPWKEIDLDADLWTVDAQRMKMRKEHTIPLSPQVKAMFQRLRELSGDSPFVFPHHQRQDEPMDGEAFNHIIRKMKWQDRITPHGTRATAASALADAGFDVNHIDAQLAHEQKSMTGRAYFRQSYLEQRRALLRAWSDMLDGLATGAKVVPIGAGKAA